VTRIDPELETRRYTEEVLATAGKGLDAQGRALLEEDLRSPCTEEIAVFRAFAEPCRSTRSRSSARAVEAASGPSGSCGRSSHSSVPTLRFEKITKTKQMVPYGVRSTPAIVIDEQVVHAGGIPTKAEVERWVQALQA